MSQRIGRPPLYNDEIAREICSVVSCTTKGLPSLCQIHEHWPSYETIYSWIRENKQPFSDMYAKAKENQADYLAEDILRIIDKPETYTENGVERNDTQMMRIKVDALKWHAMKLKPKKYGDKQIIEQTTSENEQLKAELAELRAKLDEKNKAEY